MKKLIVVVGIILIGIILGYLYNQLTVTQAQHKFEKIRDGLYLEGGRSIKFNFNSPKDSYLLKVKHVFRIGQHKEIFVNGTKLSPNIYSYATRRNVIESNYIYLPRKLIKEGNNSIDIYFTKNPPNEVTIMLSNYRKKIGNDMYILFSDSKNLPQKVLLFEPLIIGVILAITFFYLVIFLLNKFFILNIDKVRLYQIYSLLPFLVFLFSLWIGNRLSELYQIVMTTAYFWSLGLITFFVTGSSLVLRKLFQDYKLQIRIRPEILFAVSQASDFCFKIINWILRKLFQGYKLQVRKKPLRMRPVRLRPEILFVIPQASEFSLKAINWIKTREFADKCIILFIVSLLMGAFLLILNLEIAAKQFANLAYFTLLISAIIKFIKFIKDERK